MVKKIQVLEIREYVYAPDMEDYVDEGVSTIEGALELDKKDVGKRIKIEELADEIRVVGRSWRIIDEP